MPDRDESYRQVLQERHEELLRRMDAQDATLGEIKTEAKKTNGRVGRLEVHVAVLYVVYGLGAFLLGSAVTALVVDWLGRR